MISYNDEEAMNVLMGSNEINKAIICEDQIFCIMLSDFIEDSGDTIIFFTSGWESVKEKITEITKSNKFKAKKAKGIIDRDYLDSRDPYGILKSEHFITTQYHDCEIDLIHSSAFNVFIKAKASKSYKDSSAKIRETITSKIEIIGQVRQYSHKFQKSWSIPQPNMKFNKEAWITTLKEINKISPTEWKKFEEWLNSAKNDPKQIIHGHDFVSQLLAYLMRKTSKQEFSDQCHETSENLALSFDSSFIGEISWIRDICEFAENQRLS